MDVKTRLCKIGVVSACVIDDSNYCDNILQTDVTQNTTRHRGHAKQIQYFMIIYNIVLIDIMMRNSPFPLKTDKIYFYRGRATLDEYIIIMICLQ